MEEQLGEKVGLSEKLKIISEKLDEIVAAGFQTDTEIHMVSDSLDVISDTSDTIFGITEFMKEKNAELKEVSEYHKEEAENAVNEICNLIQECQEMEECLKEEKIKVRLREMVLHMEHLAEFLSDKVVGGYEDFVTVAEGYEHDVEMIDHSICEYVDMSHDIQNVVREIADSVDEIAEASQNVSNEFKELITEAEE